MTEEDLPDAELEVLACIWHQGRPTAREIREAIAGYRPLAHASVTTLLKRLEERGHIRRERGPVGKAFVYEAVRHPRPTQKKLVRQMVERIFGGSSVALVASLFETRPPDAREVAELQAMLDQLQVSRSKGKTETEDAKKRRAGRRSR